MEEQLITLETGKLAREKGFNVPVVNFYNKGKKPYVITGCEYQSDRDAITNWNDGKGSYPTRAEDVECSAPTQTLLQKWLREVHQIYVDIDIDQTTAPKFCYMISRFIGNPTNLAAEEWDWENHPNGENWHLHRKWEDALEEGLFEALKLI